MEADRCRLRSFFRLSPMRQDRFHIVLGLQLICRPSDVIPDHRPIASESLSVLPRRITPTSVDVRLIERAE